MVGNTSNGIGKASSNSDKGSYLFFAVMLLGKAEINLVSNPAGIEPKYRANICLNCMDLIHIKYCPRMTGY